MKKDNHHPEIVLPEDELKAELRRRSRRGFLIRGLAAAGGVGFYEWLTKAGHEDDVAWPQRRVLDFNQKLAHGYLSDGHLMPIYAEREITYLKPNGDIGLDTDLNANSWRMSVGLEGAKPLQLRLSDIKALPKVEMITRFCCIEGWSAIASWGGARFSDFTRKFLPPGRQLPPYVYIATPDEEYYVGLDAKSAMHPQTLLAYEHNGKPLTEDHGAPLRLVIPVKYGIKNIKRIGSIKYTSQKADDYWAEQGYDWFAGL
ncbi:MAG: molybdopterin-dependent oxidoreductase [Acidobacteriota bacterium]|nr:molybdopterin-dependent oxidoreductase [Acidobacteriota bacterium]